MRIAQLANFYTPTSGGLRTTVDHLGRGYVAAGHQRLLVTPGAVAAEHGAGADRHVVVPGRRWPGFAPYLVITDLGPVTAALDAFAPDVLEISDKLTLHRLADGARRRGIATVLMSHERIDAHVGPRVPGWFPLTRAADVVNRRLGDRFDAVVGASAFAAGEFARVGVDTVRVPLGVDLQTFAPLPVATRRLPPPTIVWLGRMSKEKRPELAVEALRVLMARGEDVAMVLVGDGPMRPALERAASGLPATFVGHLSRRAHVARVLGGADVALNTCPAETFGLTILEAMACGTPVVVANRGAAGELLAPGAGRATFLHPDAFASALSEVLSWPAAAARRAARRRAEEFPWSATVRAMLTLHARLTARRRAGTLVTT